MTSVPEQREGNAILESAKDAAAERLLGADGSIFEAFNRLGCGFDHTEALEYIGGTSYAESLPEDRRALVTGMAMAFALVAVESDRKLRNRGRWWVFR